MKKAEPAVSDSGLAGRAKGPWRSLSAVLAPFAFGVMLAGCGSLIGDYLPAAMGGTPANVPARPAEPLAYPAVHDMPPARTEAVLTEEELKKAEQELIALRDRQEQQAGSTGAKRPSR